MLLASWNVNSIKQRLPQVLRLLEAHAPDVLCLQETKARPEAFPHLELQAAGYVSLDASGGRWNGVAMLVREEHAVSDVRTELPGSPVPEEARWIEAEVAGIRVASLYVPNGRAPDDPQMQLKLAFLDAVRRRVAELGVHDEVVVLGDWNVAPRDLDVWDVTAVHGGTHISPPERAALAAVGLVDAYLASPQQGEDRFTWWDYRAGAFRRDNGMRIDLALVGGALVDRLLHVGIDREVRGWEQPSDHAPLLVRLAG